MHADAVIFDKDGTLLDFDAFWVTVSVSALKDVAEQFKSNAPMDEMLESLGVRNGVTDVDGILCKGTYRQMGQQIYDVLIRYGCTATCDEVTAAVEESYNRHSDSGEIKGTGPNLVQVLTELKNQGKKLAVVTTDNEPTTRICLQQLGIDRFFDRIYTDDGHTPTKPDPFCAADFCNVTGIPKERTVMVGDTMTDVKFAENAEIPVVILAKTEKSKAKFTPVADAVVSDLSELSDLLK